MVSFLRPGLATMIYLPDSSSAWGISPEITKFELKESIVSWGRPISLFSFWLEALLSFKELLIYFISSNLYLSRKERHFFILVSIASAFICSRNRWLKLFRVTILRWQHTKQKRPAKVMAIMIGQTIFIGETLESRSYKKRFNVLNWKFLK